MSDVLRMIAQRNAAANAAAAKVPHKLVVRIAAKVPSFDPRIVDNALNRENMARTRRLHREVVLDDALIARYARVDLSTMPLHHNPDTPELGRVNAATPLSAEEVRHIKAAREAFSLVHKRTAALREIAAAAGGQPTAVREYEPMATPPAAVRDAPELKPGQSSRSSPEARWVAAHPERPASPQYLHHVVPGGRMHAVAFSFTNREAAEHALNAATHARVPFKDARVVPSDHHVDSDGRPVGIYDSPPDKPFTAKAVKAAKAAFDAMPTKRPGVIKTLTHKTVSGVVSGLTMAARLAGRLAGKTKTESAEPAVQESAPFANLPWQMRGARGKFGSVAKKGHAQAETTIPPKVRDLFKQHGGRVQTSGAGLLVRFGSFEKAQAARSAAMAAGVTCHHREFPVNALEVYHIHPRVAEGAPTSPPADLMTRLDAYLGDATSDIVRVESVDEAAAVDAARALADAGDSAVAVVHAPGVAEDGDWLAMPFDEAMDLVGEREDYDIAAVALPDGTVMTDSADEAVHRQHTGLVAKRHRLAARLNRARISGRPLGGARLRAARRARRWRIKNRSRHNLKRKLTVDRTPHALHH